jgi:hypothetical protein
VAVLDEIESQVISPWFNSPCFNSPCFNSPCFNSPCLTQLCIDVTREYATGQSNGAMYTFWLGSVLSERLAAVAPISGSYQNGYIRAPTVPMPVIEVTGTLDTIVPARHAYFLLIFSAVYVLCCSL